MARGSGRRLGAALRKWVAIGGAVATVVGLVLAIFSGGSAGPAHSALGLLLVVVGIPTVLLVLLIEAIPPDPRHGIPGRAARAVVLPLLFVALAAPLAAVAGIVVRNLDPADYIGRFGARVRVSLPSVCDDQVRWYAKRGPQGEPYVCHGSTWQDAGVTHRGTVTLGWDDVPEGTKQIPTSVDAYVVGDDGYSVARLGRIDRVGLWGGAPPWWIVACLPLLLLTFYGLARTGLVEDDEPVATPSGPVPGGHARES